MPDYVDHMTTVIALASKAIQESRATIELQDRAEISTKLILVGELLLKAHSETLASVKSLLAQKG